MKRRYDWRSRLHIAVASFRTRPFKWGETDCVTFADACVLAMTNESVIAELTALHPYDDARGAIVALALLGYNTLDDFLAERFARVHPAYAQEGDIALMNAPLTGTALGIVLGERIGCLTESGYGTVRRSRMTGAFHIP